jgi:hydroxyacylglutathione hydrolase
MRVIPVRQLADNYAYLVFDENDRAAAVVDVAEAAPVRDAAAREGVHLVAILSTHHHFDHVAGNDELIAMHAHAPLRVYGYAGDRDRIPGLTDPLEDGAELRVGRLQARALFIPAHTRGHLAYWFPAERTVFTGDTLFGGGCGRLFEGDAAQMKASLEKIAGLPDDTLVYCGHEYTQRNLEFAATLEPRNQDLARRRAEVERQRRRGEPTIPSTIAVEKATNPFLRTDSAELRASVRSRVRDGCDDPVAVFAAVRQLKDEF